MLNYITITGKITEILGTQTKRYRCNYQRCDLTTFVLKTKDEEFIVKSSDIAIFAGDEVNVEGSLNQASFDNPDKRRHINAYVIEKIEKLKKVEKNPQTVLNPFLNNKPSEEMKIQ